MRVISPQSALLQDLTPNLKAGFSSIGICEIGDYAVQNGNQLVIADNLGAQSLVKNLLDVGSSNLLQKNPKYFVEDIEVHARLAESPDLYFQKPAEALITNCTKKEEISFSSAADKANLKMHCMDFIQGIASTNVTESVDAVIEELYMNAILDGPKEAGKGNQVGRATVTMACNDSRLAIACMDTYGSLDVQKFLRRLLEVYEKGAGQAMNMNREGGAGIGCSLIVEHSSSIFLGVLPKRMTLVSVLIPLGLGYRQRDKLQKSVHLFGNFAHNEKV